MRLYKRPGSQFWWCEASVHGKPIYFSTRTSDHGTAQQHATIEVAKRLKQQPARHVPDGLLALAAADISRSAAEGSSTKHVLVLEKQWQDIIKYFGRDADLNAINEEEINAFIVHMKTGLKGQTVRRHVASLFRGLETAYRRGWRTSLVPKKPKIRSDAPNEARAAKAHPQELIVALFKRLPVEMADASLVCMFTGLRYAELRRLEATMVKFRDDGICVIEMPHRATKTISGIRSIDVPPLATEILRRYVNQGRTILFPRVNYAKAFGQHCADLGFEQTVTLRDLRALNASVVIELSQNLMVAQQRLGHASVKTTAKYAKLRPGHELTVAHSDIENRLLMSVPDMSTVQSSVNQRTVAKKLFNLSGIMERETGFEPATFSLEGSRIRENAAFFQSVPASYFPEKSQVIPSPSGHVSAQQGARIKPSAPMVKPGEYERVLVACEKCTRESEQDVKGTMVCIYCDGPTRIVL